MHYIRRLRKHFSGNSAQGSSDTPSLDILLDRARHHYYRERYPEALEHLSQAMELARESRNELAQIDIQLSRADIWIAQGRYEEAEAILQDVRAQSERSAHHTPLAYALASLGTLAQRQQQWDRAQEYYEQARDITHRIQSDGAAGRATAHLADVYWHSGNASYAVRLFQEAIPRLIRSGDRELVGYFLGQLGQAQSDVGQEEEGLEAIKRGREQAATIKHRAQVRSLSLLLGDFAWKQQRYRQAQQYYGDALELFPDEKQHSASYIRALCQFSAAARKLGALDKAQERAQEAVALAQALEQGDCLALAKANLALTAHARQSEEALPLLQEAVQAYETLPPDEFFINMLRQIAAQQHADEAIATYKRAIDSATNLPVQRAHARSDLGTLLQGLQRHDEALEVWNQAIEDYRLAKQPDKIARLYCDIGLAYAQAGDGRLALRRYEQALEQLNHTDDRATRGVVLANVAAAYSEYGELDAAQEFFQEAISIAQQTQDRAAECARRMNYGRLLALTQQPRRAAAELHKARKLCEALDTPLYNAILTNNLGLIEFTLAHSSDAVDLFQQALDALPADAPPHWHATIECNLADALDALRRTDEATAHYDAALQQASTIQHIPILVQARIGLAKLALDSNNLEAAAQHLHEAERLARRATLRRLLARLYAQRSRLLEAQGDAERAQAAWEEGQKLRRRMQMPTVDTERLS